jgi:hypothetical protein
MYMHRMEYYLTFKKESYDTCYNMVEP